MVCCVVHAEGCVHVADVMDVIEVCEELIGELSRTVVTLPQVAAWRGNM